MSEKPVDAPLVLYVDDERPNRVVFEHSLKSEFRIKCVADAKSALEVLASQEVAVVVSDIRMAEMDGLELLRITKDKHPSVLRMVITAFSDVDPILRAINEGLVVRYIVKPWQIEEVRQSLRWATELWTIGKNSAELLRRILQTEKLASLGGLTSLFLHDIRTPLMSAAVAIEELRALAESVPELHLAITQAPIDQGIKARMLEKLEPTRALVTEVQEGTTMTIDMVKLFWEYVKPSEKAKERPIIDPLPIVQRAVAMYKRVVTEAPIDYRGPDHLPNIRMAPVELSQVLLNLISNATQAVLARGERKGVVEVDARPQGDMLELRVRDEGVGMAPEVLRRVGTPWFTTRTEGTGLGVANCQRLVGSCGGRLRIESEQGVGTTVTILLPTAA